MAEEKDLEGVKQEIAAIVKDLPLTVTTRGESDIAKSECVRIRKEIKTREKWFNDKILAHSKATYDLAKAGWNAQKLVLVDLLHSMKMWTETTDANILRFERTERERLAKEQAAEEAKYFKRQETAERKGADPSNVKPPKLVVAAPKSTRTSHGLYTVKEEKVLWVLDESVVPEQFWTRTLNRKLIEATLRNGGEVPGCLLDTKLGSAVR